MQSKKVSVLLVGIGGFGKSYLRELLAHEEKNFEIVGAVDPAAEQTKYYSDLKERGVSFYNDVEAFYADKGADLVVISSPIQYHCPQSTYALSQGSNVLCEKPLAAVVQDGLKMKKVRDEAEGFLDIGYQWSHSKAILDLKRDIMKGVFGQPRRAKTIILWPRDLYYYNRSSWAGKIKDDNGEWILDSVANNATAHYLHNLFFVLGEEINKSQYPGSLVAELYRANDIENYDTSVARIITENNVELLYYASHAVKEKYDPAFCFEFEKGKVVYGELEEGEPEKITAIFNDGSKKSYGDPEVNRKRKLWLALEATEKGEDFVYCGPEAALPHTISINGFQESATPIKNFPEKVKNFDSEKKQFWVENLNEILIDAYREGKLCSEMDVSWATAGKEMELDSYDFFSGDGQKN
ncbi:MAG: Gfo/Idh/MocA family protein [Halanaerobiaceae bacterium]